MMPSPWPIGAGSPGPVGPPGAAGAGVVANRINTGNIGGTKLVDVNCTPFINGTLAWVQSVGRMYSLVKNPSAELNALIDGITVVSSVATPSARWVALPETSAIERFEANTPTYLDTVNGNDDNDGLAALTPIKSAGEFSRRLLIDDDIKTPVLVTWVGDNLTIGFPDNDDGPRYPASQLLITAGYTSLTYVGTVFNGAATPPTQNYTAYANAVTEQFGPFVLAHYGKGKQVPRATCFRICVGADDAYQQPVPAHFAAALENLLTSILGLFPNACVSMALICPNHDITGPGPGIFVTAANLLIPGVVAAMQAKGQHIVLEAAAGLVFPGDYNADGVHLNATGDAKVAVVAAAGIEAALALIGIGPNPIPSRQLYEGVTTVAGGGNAVLGPFQLNGTETPQLSCYIQNNPGVAQEFAGESSAFGCAWYYRYAGPEAANQFHVFLLNNGGFARDFRMRVFAVGT